MFRSTHEELKSAFCRVEDFFVQKLDAYGVPGATADQKITSALGQLSLGVSVGAFVEYVLLNESTISNA